jgi:outer membrane protein insertion porin family
VETRRFPRAVPAVVCAVLAAVVLAGASPARAQAARDTRPPVPAEAMPRPEDIRRPEDSTPLILLPPREREVVREVVEEPLHGPLVDLLEEAQGERLASVRVEGNRRVATETVLEALGLKEGEVLTSERLAEALRALFTLGQFADLQLETEPVPGGVALVVRVEERPLVRQVRFEGNDFLRLEELREAAAIESGQVVRPVELQAAARRIEALYETRGFALAEVSPELVPVRDEERVDVRFVIRERPRVRVQQVNFTGELPVPEAELREVALTQAATVFTPVTGRGYLREEVLAQDVESLTSYLRERGYLRASVQPQVSLSPDRRFAYVTFTLEPGQRFLLESLRFEGDPLPPALIQEVVDVEEGQVMRPSQVGEDIEQLRRHLQDQGHAFAEVTPLTEFHPERGTVELILRVREGPRVCIGAVEVVGNERTLEHVILRELTLEQGDAFSGTAVRRGEEALRALGFFSEVQVFPRPADNPCGAVLVVRVVERLTRFYRLSLGFASVEQLIITGRLADQNFMGRGMSLSSAAQYSRLRSSIELSLVEPYLAGTPASLNAETFWTRMQLPNYLRESAGGNAAVAWRLERLREVLRGGRVAVGYGFQRVRLDAAPELLEALGGLDFFRDGRISVARLTFSYDRLTMRLPGAGGFFALGSLEYAPAFLGSTLRFARYTLATQGSVPLPSGFSFNARGRVGLLESLGEAPLPLSEQFFLGGIDSVRGYVFQSISPTVAVQVPTLEGGVETREVAVGGNKQFVLNLELEFPLAPRVGLRGLFFYDAGNVFAANQPFFVDRQHALPFGLFQAVGVGVRWQSPFGPLRLEAGIPLNRRPGDRPILIELAVGAAGLPGGR